LYHKENNITALKQVVTKKYPANQNHTISDYQCFKFKKNEK